jgi:hypothetical protein
MLEATLAQGCKAALILRDARDGQSAYNAHYPVMNAEIHRC